MKDKLLVVCGPTATGKTALGLELAKRFNGELISADSRQVYKGMDIGTGKDVKKEFMVHGSWSMVNFKDKRYKLFAYDINGIKLWMYDVVNPDEEFSVGHYQYLAQQVINDILNRGKLPIVVGGTGLYIKSLISPIETAVIPPNPELRRELENKTVAELTEYLKKIAPQAYKQMNNSDKNNPRRLVRKIEIACTKAGSSRQTISLPSKQDVLMIGLTAPLSIVDQRIDDRVERRISQGIINEIKTLLNKGYSWDLPAMSGLGYREWRTQGTGIRGQGSDNEEIVNQWKKDEKDYVRRQLTWFRKQKKIRWFDISNSNYLQEVVDLVSTWYTKIDDQQS